MIFQLLLTLAAPSFMAAIQYRLCSILVSEHELPIRVRRRLFVWGATGAIILSIAIQCIFLELKWPYLRGDIAARTLFEGALIAPLSEELAKALPLALLLATGIIIGRRAFLAAGIVSAIGFFWSETLLSLLGAPGAHAWTAQLIERTILRGFNHACFAGFCSLGFGSASLQSQTWHRWFLILAGFLLSVFVHGMNNTFGVAGMFGLPQQASHAANKLTLALMFFYILLFMLALRRRRSKETTPTSKAS